MRILKILGGLFAFILIFTLSSSVYAMTILKADEGSGNVKIESEQVIDDNVITAGNEVIIRGEVTDDVMAFGQSVKVEGTIFGNLITGANEVIIEGSVEGDVYAGANSVSISKNGHVGRDLVCGANTVDIEGDVGRNVWAGSASINIDGIVGGDITAAASRQIDIDKSAKVNGKLTYYNNKQMNIVNQENIAEGVSFNKTEQAKKSFGSQFSSWILGLVMAIIFALLLLVFFPKRTKAIADVIKGSWLKSLGIGILGLIVAPIIAIICMILIVGLPIGLVLLTVYFILLYLAKFWVAMCLGNFITKKKWNPYWTMILGIVILYLLYLIPFIGPIIAFIVILIGLGGLYLSKPLEGEK